MKCHVVPLLLLGALLVVGGPASADETSSKLKTITVDGVADIVGENVAAARQAAIQDAQRTAIEMTAGVHLQSILTQDAFSQAKDGQEKFGQTVTAKLSSNTSGFLEGYDLISEQREGKTYKVTLKVKVKDLELERQLSIQARALAGARFPKIMVLVQELYTDKSGAEAPAAQQTLQPMIEDALLARGFDLVARDKIAAYQDDPKKTQVVLTDDALAARVAKEAGAEFFVRASASVSYVSYNDLEMQDYHGITEVTMSAVNSSSGMIVASHKEKGNSPPNCYSEADLRVKAVRALAPKVIDNLVQGLLRSWDQDAQRGVRYSVKLTGFKSLRKEALVFLDVLKSIEGVKGVKQISSGAGQLDAEVFYGASADVEKLQSAILKAVEGHKEFESLDIESARARELSFKM